MRPLTASLASLSTSRQNIDQAKLKLKNESPGLLKSLVSTLAAESRAGNTAVPVAIAAMAELHAESTYRHAGRELPVGRPKDAFEAAAAFSDLKHLAVSPNPGRPLPRRTTSQTSTSSASSTKSVRFADLAADAQVLSDAKA